MEWLEIPGMFILVGFVGAWVLIFAAKIVMTHLLQRKEDYYEGGKHND